MSHRRATKKSRPLGAASNGALGEKWQRRPSLREGEKLGRDHHTGTKNQNHRTAIQPSGIEFDAPAAEKLTRLKLLMNFRCV
jgi:hypothetical protein